MNYEKLNKSNNQIYFDLIKELENKFNIFCKKNIIFKNDIKKETYYLQLRVKNVNILTTDLYMQVKNFVNDFLDASCEVRFLLKNKIEIDIEC